MALPATTALVGGFPGDDAKIEAVNALLASGSLAVFDGSATKLIAEVESLPYSSRIGVVSKLAAATGSKDALKLVRALLSGGDGDVVSDSDDDELVMVFGASTKSSTAAYDHRQLALHIASAAKLGDVILDELDGSIKTMQGFALKESCVGRFKSAAKKIRSATKGPNARQHLISDQQLINRIVGADIRPSDRVELLVGCMKHRRKTVLDAVLPTMAEKPETIVKYLHGASPTTVAALLPRLRAEKPQEGSPYPPGWISGLTVKWDRLWKFHATTYS